MVKLGDRLIDQGKQECDMNADIYDFRNDDSDFEDDCDLEEEEKLEKRYLI